jgi:hypothetical protein
MEDISPRIRFSENVRWLIQRNTRFGGTGVVHRQKVEDSGADLGMSKVAACEQFLTLQGSLWDVYTDSLVLSRPRSSETNKLETARRWLEIHDVVVLA